MADIPAKLGIDTGRDGVSEIGAVRLAVGDSRRVPGGLASPLGMKLANPRDGVSSTLAVCLCLCPVCGTAMLLLGTSAGRANSLAEDDGTIEVDFSDGCWTRRFGAGVALTTLGVASTTPFSIAFRVFPPALPLPTAFAKLSSAFLATSSFAKGLLGFLIVMMASRSCSWTMAFVRIFCSLALDIAERSTSRRFADI